ncbi:MAG: hypothetical protein VXW20_04640, partial [Pseudomonadota bacterium]|nr:hypothetical protein [Pseudomonadota bacterium]
MPFAVAFANLKLPQKGTLLLAVKKGRALGALGRDLDKKTARNANRSLKDSSWRRDLEKKKASNANRSLKDSSWHRDLDKKRHAMPTGA